MVSTAEAALNEGVLPVTPHWGEEDDPLGDTSYGKGGRIVHEPYPSLPGDYAAFTRISIGIFVTANLCRAMPAVVRSE